MAEADRNVQNDALERALEADRSHPSAREELFRALIGAKLLVPWAGSTFSPAQVTVVKSAEASGIPAFTSPQEMDRFFESQGSINTAIMEAPILAQIAIRQRHGFVVINPQRENLRLSKAELVAVSESLVPTGDGMLTIARNTNVTVGMPANRPSDDAIALFREAAMQAGLRNAFWCAIQIGSGLPHLAFGIEPLEGTDFPTRADRIWAEHGQGMPTVTFVQLNDEVGEMVRERGESLLTWTES